MKSIGKKRVLVHLHLFYHEQIDYLLEKLSNINSCSWDLFVTYIKDNKEVLDKILNFKKDAKLIKVDNIGYDVYPFIKIIQNINLDDYDFILKLHTKSIQQPKIELNNIFYKNSDWRDELFDSLLKNKKRFKNNLKKFNNPSIGIVCSKALLFKEKNAFCKDEAQIAFTKQTKKLNFDFRKNPFVAGTMFMSRASIYKFLQKIDLKKEEFISENKTNLGFTLAHAYERLLTMVVFEQNYKASCIKCKRKFFKLYLKNILKFFFSSSNIYLKDFKIKQICLCGFKIKIFPKSEKDIIYKNSINIFKKFNSKNNSSNKRTAIFVSFNKTGKILATTVSYLENLKKHCDNILFITNNLSNEKELEKIKDLISYAYTTNQTGQDFYLYKKGYFLAKDLNLLQNSNELIFCNDSQYIPIMDLETILNNQDPSLDIYGAKPGYEIKEHILSFFFIVKRRLFNSKIFEEFMHKIKKEKTLLNSIIKYEIEFITFLLKHGYNYDTIIHKYFDNPPYNVDKMFSIKMLLKNGYPFIDLNFFKNQNISNQEKLEVLEYIKNKNESIHKTILNTIKTRGKNAIWIWKTKNRRCYFS